MMVTLDKKEIEEAIREYLSNEVGSRFAAFAKYTWYIESDKFPWKLEANSPETADE